MAINSIQIILYSFVVLSLFLLITFLYEIIIAEKTNSTEIIFKLIFNGVCLGISLYIFIGSIYLIKMPKNNAPSWEYFTKRYSDTIKSNRSDIPPEDYFPTRKRNISKINHDEMDYEDESQLYYNYPQNSTNLK